MMRRKHEADALFSKR